MDDAMKAFDKRQNAVRRKHERMAQGYVTKMDRNGVIQQVPDRKGFRIVLRLLIGLALLFTALKVLLVVGLGTDAYLEQVATLETGSQVEQIGAVLMQLDPVTTQLSEWLIPLFNS